jgi:beta-glucuronidase
MLKPQNSSKRELVNLDGIWDFKVDFKDSGITDGWWKKPLSTDLDIAVPSSYNDLFADTDIRNHVGNVWYQRKVFVPKGWNGDRVFVRVDAATHEGIVYIKKLCAIAVGTCRLRQTLPTWLRLAKSSASPSLFQMY